jgi:hypothetical protein
MYTDITNCEATQNVRKSVFLVRKYTIWQPWSSHQTLYHTYALSISRHLFSTETRMKVTWKASAKAYLNSKTPRQDSNPGPGVPQRAALATGWSGRCYKVWFFKWIVAAILVFVDLLHPSKMNVKVLPPNVLELCRLLEVCRAWPRARRSGTRLRLLQNRTPSSSPTGLKIG